MELIIFVITILCFLYFYKEYRDAIVNKKFKTKTYFSIKRISIAYLKYNKIQCKFYIETDERKIIFEGSYGECLKYLKKNGYEEEKN